MSKHENLAGALAAFQAELPEIAKGETAEVPTKNGGKYTYTYASLADVSAAVLPKLAAHGLSWSCLPTHNDQGAFVLAYRLMHESGEALEGSYPLPTGAPQQVGSAITYARRYCLSAVTGVAPDEDDDGQAAQQAAAPKRRQPRQQARPEPASEPEEKAEPEAEWRMYAADNGVTPTSVLAKIVREWPKNDQHRRPNKVGDIDALVEKDPDVKALVSQAITELADAQEPAA